ncbi:MAG TPA: HAD family hydrolase [Longimicrobiales bacterium]|nr:HAD family hydrolase [Longimicrobiales bacterium]
MKKLILFDIDGTLLSTDGAASRAFHRALLEVYGTAGPITSFDFHGRTDREIARTLLRVAGFDDGAIDGRFAALWSVYLRELAVELNQASHRTRVMPGVVALLDALARRADAVVLGLLTGNIEEGARLKLASCGLNGRFALGAFGSDDEERDRLGAVAVGRARDLLGVTFRGADIVVVGDTPRDVQCARPVGARAVAVATGRHTVEELEEAGADAALADLSDLDLALAAILGAAPGTGG